MTTQPEKPWLIVRLDDVRGRCKKQDRVCDLLEEYGAPIHLEVIPEDLDEIGATDLREENSRRSVAVLCHQHGYRHFNHGTDGRRCEFGDHRGLRTSSKIWVLERNNLPRSSGRPSNPSSHLPGIATAKRLWMQRKLQDFRECRCCGKRAETLIHSFPSSPLPSIRFAGNPPLCINLGKEP